MALGSKMRSMRSISWTWYCIVSRSSKYRLRLEPSDTRRGFLCSITRARNSPRRRAYCSSEYKLSRESFSMGREFSRWELIDVRALRLQRKRGLPAPFPRVESVERSGVETVQRLLEAIGVGPLGLGQGLEPVGDLVEALVAGGFRHARVHVGVLVGLAGDGRLEVIGSAADGQARRRVAGLLEVFEVAVRVAGLTLGGGAKHGGHVVVTLDVG